MTNEEAVVILKNAIKKPNTKDGYLGQALTMAIKALEQLQEKPEYIDIWNVGAILRNVPEQPDICKIYGGVCGYPIEACSECLKHEGWRPSKEQTRWIPVSERLPKVMEGTNGECSDDVLICVADDENITISTGFYGYYPNSKTEQGWWSMWAYGCHQLDSKYKAIAWMPLPQPYKVESEDKE